jgi:hypothetical protein
VPPLGGEIPFKPVLNFITEGFLFRREAQIHESNYERQRGVSPGLPGSADSTRLAPAVPLQGRRDRMADDSLGSPGDVLEAEETGILGGWQPTFSAGPAALC